MTSSIFLKKEYLYFLGGEGGLVAAACVPFGIGSDIGGSIRCVYLKHIRIAKHVNVTEGFAHFRMIFCWYSRYVCKKQDYFISSVDDPRHLNANLSFMLIGSIFTCKEKIFVV